MKKRTKLEGKRKKLIKELIRFDPWISGSAVEIKRICGSKGCICRRGGPKHPAMFLTWKEDRKTRCLYVPRRLESEVKTWTNNYRQIRTLMRRITQIQRDIICLREG